MSALPTPSFPFFAVSVAYFTASSTLSPESKSARAVIAVLFHVVASFTRGRALMLGALVQHVPLGKPLFHPVAPDLVGMNVFAPVDPGPSPGRVVDDHHVRAPIKSGNIPSPTGERNPRWSRRTRSGLHRRPRSRAAAGRKQSPGHSTEPGCRPEAQAQS